MRIKRIELRQVNRITQKYIYSPFLTCLRKKGMTIYQ